MSDSKIEAQKEAGAIFLKANKEKEGVMELPGGLQYLEIKKGTGARPLITDTVKAHYKGALLDGKEFDNSFKRGQPFTAPLRSIDKRLAGSIAIDAGRKFMAFVDSFGSCIRRQGRRTGYSRWCHPAI